MHSVGQVAELWRYPVSSFGGERVDHLTVTADGALGDRTFLAFDTITGEPASPETSPRWRGALMLLARTRPDGAVEIGFPDGRWHPTDAPDLSVRLTMHFGFSVGLGRRAGSAGETLFGSEADTTAAEDAGHALPEIVPRYTASAVHLLTEGSMAALFARDERLDLDVRRFRPGILVRTEAAGAFEENGWIGRRLTIGSAVITATEGTKRCGMTMIAQPGLVEDPEVLRGILRHNRRNLGIYADVTGAGSITVGDPVMMSRED